MLTRFHSLLEAIEAIKAYRAAPNSSTVAATPRRPRNLQARQGTPVTQFVASVEET